MDINKKYNENISQELTKETKRQYDLVGKEPRMYMLMGIFKRRNNCLLYFCFAVVFFLLSNSGCSVNENNDSDEMTGPPVDVYERKITVDGETDDWGDLVAQVVDPSGDCAGFSGIDITGLYIAKNEDSLFIRVSSVGNELPSWSNTWLYFNRAGNGNHSFAVEIQRKPEDDEDSLQASLWDTTAAQSYDEYVLIYDGIIQIQEGDKEIELAISLESIDLQSFHHIWFYTHDSDTKNYDETDAPVILNCRAE